MFQRLQQENERKIKAIKHDLEQLFSGYKNLFYMHYMKTSNFNIPVDITYQSLASKIHCFLTNKMLNITEHYAMKFMC